MIRQMVMYKRKQGLTHRTGDARSETHPNAGRPERNTRYYGKHAPTDDPIARALSVAQTQSPGCRLFEI